MGKYATETVYSDIDIAQLKSIPDTALHRSIDLAAIAADEEGACIPVHSLFTGMEADPRAGYARTYLITPGLIYGLASGPVFDAGIANRTSGSRQIPSLIRAALDRQRSGTIGPGKAVWPIIHVDDGTTHSSCPYHPYPSIEHRSLTPPLTHSCRPVPHALRHGARGYRARRARLGGVLLPGERAQLLGRHRARDRARPRRARGRACRGLRAHAIYAG